MTGNEWLVGAMRMAATLYDRQENTLRISSEHGDNFVEGMLTMKAQKRVALAVKRPASLVTGNFTFA
jgi:HK97 family phage major capsid protein